ncbi:MAG: type I-E CRISPR-associated protein Cse2/CasB [Chromatiaceae bacterium]|jgi:CRISPR type I-E-associated protein CasB/Cse2|nr:type I-E CRISPR-associated protein Cse2/CasB [Chromatiaceae bacterium]
MTELASERIDPAEIVYRWWADLTRSAEPGQPSHRGELAQLRRCKNLEEVLFVPPYHALYFRTVRAGWGDRLRIAAVAGALSHLKGEVESSKGFAAFLATPKEHGQGPRVSESRFQRLMKEKELNDFYPALLRVFHLAGEKAPLSDLIRGVYDWGDPFRGDRIRRDWTFAYYNQLLDNQKP